jgi:hypothetical protein
MSKLLWSLIKTTPIVLGAAFVVGTQDASAAPENEKLIAQAIPSVSQLRQQNQQRMDGQVDSNQPMEQVTSVSELRDVQPTEWAYEALRSLVERYGCIVGYPDQTYRGNRALTRWEFAAGLNACMNTIERLIQENVAVLKEDVDTLKRLTQEFEAELAALGGRVDNLEGRVAFLEDHQFSTTTKLKGEVIFSVADTFGDFADDFEEDPEDIDEDFEDDDDGDGEPDPTQTVFQARVRLNLETSFTGEDMLRTRLQAGNFEGGRFDNSGVGTNMARLAYDDGEGMDVTIDDLFYRTPIGDKVTVWVGANGLDLDDVFSTASPYLESSGTGSLSRLGRYNNLVYRGPSGAGGAIKFQPFEQLYVTATYLAEDDDASDPSEGSGLFNGSYSAGAQVGFLPTEDIELAATYVYSYRTGGDEDLRGVGLFRGITGDDAEFPFGPEVATTAHRAGLSASWRITDIINIGAWGGYAAAEAHESADRDLGGVDIWTWAANLSILDLGKEGAVLSFVGGAAPRGEYRVVDVDTSTYERVDDQAYFIQAQYNFPINDNIIINPGAYVILNPDNNDNNDAIWVGVLRTTFKF